MEKNEKNRPVKKARCGKISISVWRQKRLLPGDKASTGYVEQYVEFWRACVQHSSKSRNTGAWQNQQIWLNVDELRDLANAMDELDREGDTSPSPSEDSHKQHGSVKAHRIVEYIKSNSLDAGLDIFDLQELSVEEILGEYGIHARITLSERRLIRHDLRKLIEQTEFSEVSYLAQSCSDPLLVRIHN